MNNLKYKKGIENLPLRQINTSCPILVLVVNLETEEVVQEFKMDYASIEDRKHLGRITFWCVQNKHSVETMALKDVDIPYINSGE